MLTDISSEQFRILRRNQLITLAVWVRKVVIRGKEERMLMVPSVDFKPVSSVRVCSSMRILSDNERDVINQLQSDPAIEVPVISERLSISKSSVRYIIDKLHNDGVLLRPAPFIDICKLGYTEYAIYLVLTSDSTTDVDLSTVDQSCLNGISLVVRLGGAYNAMICVYAKSVREASEIFHRFAREVEWKIVTKTVSVRISFDFLGYRYFSGKQTTEPRIFSIGESDSEAHDIDRTDQLILATMSCRGDLSRRELARALNVPHSTLENRIRRLEERGIIRGYEYIFNPERLGIQMYRVLVRADQCSNLTRDRFRALAARDPRIVLIAECMGDWDFELGIHLSRESSLANVHDVVSAYLSSEILSVDSIPTLRYLRVVPFPFDEAFVHSLDNEKELASSG